MIDSKKNKDTQVYADLKNRLARQEHLLTDAEGLLVNYQMRMQTLAAKKQQLLDDKAQGVITRNKRLTPRKDYFHHFQEMEQGVGGLFRILKVNADIDPSLVGISENTKPKTKWTGFMQKREGGKYTENAVRGMLNYIRSAEYILAYDPLIAELREIEAQFGKVSAEMHSSDSAGERLAATNANQFRDWLTSFTNILAGKSNVIDRVVSDKTGLATRKVLKAINVLNSRIKRNVLLFNARSSIVQISNLINAVSMVNDPRDWLNGMRLWASTLKDTQMREIFSKSAFLSQRFMEVASFDENILMKAVNFGGWMLSVGDSISCKLTWWAAYSKYTRNPKAVNKKGFRTYNSAVDYADDVTRRAHGGRGVGELPSLLTSKIVNLVAPFQVEMLNTYNNLKQLIGRKKALGILEMEAAIFGFNSLTLALFGSTVLGFDFFRVIYEAIKNAFRDDDDEDKEDAGYFVKRTLGEFMSGLPFASQLANLFIPDEANRKMFFGEDDPTRYGTGTMTASAVGDAISSIASGDWWKILDSIATIVFPFGGKQFVRTSQGLHTVAQGYSYRTDKDGNKIIQYPVEQTAGNWIRGGLFGKWSTAEGQEYIDSGHALSVDDSKNYMEATAAGIDGKDFFYIKSKLDEIGSDIDYEGKVVKSAGTKKREYLLNDKSLTTDQKLMLDRMLISDSDYKYETDDTRLIKLTYDEETKRYSRETVVDYRDTKWYELSQTKFYDAGRDIIFTGSGNIDQVLKYAQKEYSATDDATTEELRKQARAELMSETMNADDKAKLDVLMRHNSNYTAEGDKVYSISENGDKKLVADYSSVNRFLITENGWADRANNANDLGVTDAVFLSYAQKRSKLEDVKNSKGQTTKTVKTQFTELLLKDKKLNASQRFALDLSFGTGVSMEYKKNGDSWAIIETFEDGSKETTKYTQKGNAFFKSDGKVYRDYTSIDWYNVSVKSDKAYRNAKTMNTKYATSPSTFLRVYEKCYSFEADKDSSGKSISGSAKKKVVYYLESQSGFSKNEIAYFLEDVMDYAG